MANPYILQVGQTQDISGLQPVYQNLGAQQQYQNQAIAQGQQLAQQAGQYNKPSDPLAMAAALRKADPNNITPLQNAQAWYNSKFGRDPLQPDVGAAADIAQQYYGDTYNPLAGWSS